MTRDKYITHLCNKCAGIKSCKCKKTINPINKDIIECESYINYTEHLKTIKDK